MPNICLSVSVNALQHNFRLLREKCTPCEVGAVVKANAYGLGVPIVVPALDAAGCRCFFVNRFAEGLEVRRHTAASVYVFDGLMDGETPEDCRHYGLIPVFSTFEALSRFPEEQDIAVRLDTGLNMAGLSVCDESRLEKALSGRRVAFLMSHLSCAERPGDEKNVRQRRLFEKWAARFPTARKSLAASYGIALGESYWFDMVRSGASLYGAEILEGSRPAVRLSARVGWIERYGAGESLGYNGAAVLKHPATVATLLIGSGDGIVHREGCFVDYRGTLLPVLGTPTTNYLAVDASLVADRIAPGDSMDLFSETCTLDRLAREIGETVGADFLIRLRESIPRRAV